MTTTQQRMRVLLSYSHDSPEHRERVLELANRLRAEGVDARLDRYVEGSPPEGWPAWMYNEIKRSDFVVVVCTEAYHRRALGQEEPGRGLGAAWEGAIITHVLYENQSRNDKFIPVVFRPGDARFIPYFLKGATRHDLATEAGYEGLHRHLTGQHETPMPELGAVRQRPPKSRSGGRRGSGGDEREEIRPSRSSKSPKKSTSVAVNSRMGRSTGRAKRLAGTEPFLVRFPDGHFKVFGATRIEAGDEISVTLEAADPTDSAQLQSLAPLRGSRTIAVAYATQAFSARLTNLRHEIASGIEVWHLALSPDRVGRSIVDEISTTGYSADDIAVLRARRILLDEALPGRPSFLSRPNAWSGPDGTLESLVRGYGGLTVERSPLPALFAEWHRERSGPFATIARLVAVYWLISANVVETIQQLDMNTKRVKGEPALQVRFRGTRRKFYDNAAPMTITVEGTCSLTQTPTG